MAHVHGNTRTPARRRSFRPQLEELDARVVPALYSVNLTSPFEGIPGQTAATHSGGLAVNPNLPTVNSKVVVGAANPADAVRAALHGTVTVALNGVPVAYTFGRPTAGLSADAHRPFFVEVSGASGKVWLEDLAELPGVDWDYDDRSWGVTVQAFEAHGKGSHGPSGGDAGTYQLIDEASWTWADSVGNTASVSYQVTADASMEWTWRYTVTNNSLSVTSKDNYGVGTIDIPAEVGAEVYDVEVISGVTGWVGTEGYPSWYLAQGEDYLAPGETAVFQFKSPPQPILEGTGMAMVWARPPMVGSGPAKGPAKVEVVLTDRHSEPIPVEGTMKVAKWHDAFQMAADNKSVEVKGPTATTNLDFIDRDDDRFNVWVYNNVAWAAQTPRIQVKISTANVAGFTAYDDAATAVDLVRYTGGIAGKAAGWYWSDSQMLVSNEIDDVEEWYGYLAPDEGSPGEDALPKHGFTWKVSDRTHRIALRGTVKAMYELAQNQTRSTERVAKVTKNVKVHVNILKVGGAQLISDTDAAVVMRKSNEQFAQVGLQLVPAYNVQNSPVNLQNGFISRSKAGDVTADEGILFDANGLSTAATDDVELYFVNFFADDDTRGQSYCASEVNEAKYADRVVISVDRRTPFTVPHEIGHVLLNSGAHYTASLWPANLMRDEGTSKVDTADASKRLFVDQQHNMVGNPSATPPTEAKRPNLLTGP